MSIDTDALRQLVHEATSGSNALPRLVLEVGTIDKVVFEEAAGVKILRTSSDNEGPSEDNMVTPESIFWMASQTKLITALAGAQMIEKGLFTLDSFAEDFVPEMRDMHILTGFDEDDNEIFVERKSKVTIKQLFTHTGGTTFTWASKIHEKYRLKHGIERVAEGKTAPRSVITGIPYLTEPGTEFNYSLCTDLLALAVEGASGMDFEAYCQKFIFGPLGIDDMVFRRDPSHIALQVNAAAQLPGGGYAGEEFKGAIRPISCSGGGGLYSSARSFLKLLRTLLNNGVYHDTGVRIIEDKTMDLMCTPLIEEEKLQRGMWAHLKGDLPLGKFDDEGFNMSRNLGLVNKVMLVDVPGGRRKGTYYGSGFANTFWLIDRKAGVAFTFMVNIVPSRDTAVIEFYKKFETELYRGLLKEGA